MNLNYNPCKIKFLSSSSLSLSLSLYIYIVTVLVLLDGMRCHLDNCKISLISHLERLQRKRKAVLCWACS